MERETTIFETPVGKEKVELKTYLIGREKRALQSIYLEKNLSVSSDGANITGLDADTVERAQELGWKTCIVSIEGQHEGDPVVQADGTTKPFSIVDSVLDMHSEDYNAVIAKVNELTTEKKT